MHESYFPNSPTIILVWEKMWECITSTTYLHECGNCMDLICFKDRLILVLKPTQDHAILREDDASLSTACTNVAFYGSHMLRRLTNLIFQTYPRPWNFGIHQISSLFACLRERERKGLNFMVWVNLQTCVNVTPGPCRFECGSKW
jgi:hypothetical protein